MNSLISAWLQRDPDPKTRQEVQQLVDRNDTAGLNERFGPRLEFGTAGLRGLLGAGPSRMNRLVVRETTAGLGHYLLKQVPDAKSRGVVVGFDGRHYSHTFAEDTACVLGALGIKVHLFTDITATPVVAFAVADLHAAAGVMVTASHNPPEYNGYKVYWGNGAQIIPPHDVGIAAAIEAAAKGALPWQELSALQGDKLVSSLGDAMEKHYLDGVAALSVHAPTATRAQMRIAYTPMHGVGAHLAEVALQRAGFTQVQTVPEQRAPDGDFPTVRFPNPEEPGAMDLVVALAQRMDADLACANDPDADRFAVAVRTAPQTYRLLTGNEVGVLLGDDLLQKAPASAAMATSIVSSRLLGRMCAQHKVRYFETLTGFKWIADGALACKRDNEHFLFGYEEALGYTIGELVRDKDGVSAVVAFAELTAACRDAGVSLLDRLEAIYRQHGLFVTAQRSIGLSAHAPGDAIGERLRRNKPTSIAGLRIVRTDDLWTRQRTQQTAEPENIALPQSDVLCYYLEHDERVIVRPSGTEPKIKCYYEICETMHADETFIQAQARADLRLKHLMDAHQKELSILATKSPASPGNISH